MKLKKVSIKQLVQGEDYYVESECFAARWRHGTPARFEGKQHDGCYLFIMLNESNMKLNQIVQPSQVKDTKVYAFPTSKVTKPLLERLQPGDWIEGMPVRCGDETIRVIGKFIEIDAEGDVAITSDRNEALYLDPKTIRKVTEIKYEE